MPKRKPRKPRKNKKVKNRYYKLKLVLISFVFIVLLMFLSFRVLFLNVVHGKEYERSSIFQQVNKGFVDRIILPNRGSILDRYKHTLASSETVYNVIFDVKKILPLKKEKQDKIILTLNEILDIPIEDLNNHLNNKNNADRNYVIIANGVSRETAFRLEDANPLYVSLEEDTKRTYPNGNIGNGLIGFMRGDNFYGLEKYYNQYLVGEEGRAYRNASNYIESETKLLPAEQGSTLVTTIDLNIQEIAEDVLLEIAEEYSPIDASIIITNPYTGEVYAYGQYPNFDLNNPMDERFVTDSNFPDNWEQITNEEKNMYFYNLWKDTNLDNSFEPGSIYKPIVVGAALEENIISQSDIFTCTGLKWIGKDKIPCAGGAVHGVQNLEQVLSNSCNSAMIDIIFRLGSEKYRKYQKDFGFGELTGIDLPEIYSFDNLLHNEAALKNPLNLATNSMGQGFNTSQIQMISAFAATINGGNLMRPYVVSQVVDKNGAVVLENKPIIVRKVISQEVSDTVRKMLRSVITPQGTGRRAIIEGYEIGGKTGTAQQGIRIENNYAYSFIGYISVESPEYLVSVSINQPQKETEDTPTPAYAFKEVMTRLIKYKEIRPANENDLYYGDDAFDMPDLSGMSVVEASRVLSEMEIDYDFSGIEGNIVRSHIPTAGNKITSNTKVYIYIYKDDSEMELSELLDVTGFNQSYAEEVLIKQGFVPIFVDATYSETIGVTENETDLENIDEEEAGNENIEPLVVIQMPSSGKYLPRGTVIKVKVK